MWLYFGLETLKDRLLENYPQTDESALQTLLQGSCALTLNDEQVNAACLDVCKDNQCYSISPGDIAKIMNSI